MGIFGCYQGLLFVIPYIAKPSMAGNNVFIELVFLTNGNLCFCTERFQLYKTYCHKIKHSHWHRQHPITKRQTLSLGQTTPYHQQTHTLSLEQTTPYHQQTQTLTETDNTLSPTDTNTHWDRQHPITNRHRHSHWNRQHPITNIHKHSHWDRQQSITN